MQCPVEFHSRVLWLMGRKFQVLIIAHRLETILMADRVLLLDRGKLEEVSKPSLLAQDGQYASLALNGHPATHESNEA